MSGWQRMNREQLERRVRELGEKRGNRRLVAAGVATAEQAVDRLVQAVMQRVPDSGMYNVRIHADGGQATVDVHLAGEGAGSKERARYNQLRSIGQSHGEAVESMIQAGTPADYVKPAVGQSGYIRVGVPLKPGGHLFTRSEDLGRADNPNAAAEVEE